MQLQFERFLLWSRHGKHSGLGKSSFPWRTSSHQKIHVAFIKRLIRPEWFVLSLRWPFELSQRAVLARGEMKRDEHWLRETLQTVHHFCVQGTRSLGTSELRTKIRSRRLLSFMSQWCRNESKNPCRIWFLLGRFENIVSNSYVGAITPHHGRTELSTWTYSSGSILPADNCGQFKGEDGETLDQTEMNWCEVERRNTCTPLHRRSWCILLCSSRDLVDKQRPKLFCKIRLD